MEPPPKPVAEGERITWGDIFNDWQTVTADMAAVYGPGVLTDDSMSWWDFRALILGLAVRPDVSVFAANRLDKADK